MPTSNIRKTSAQKAWATANTQQPVTATGTTPRAQALAKYRHMLGSLTPFAAINARELGVEFEFDFLKRALTSLVKALEG